MKRRVVLALIIASFICGCAEGGSSSPSADYVINDVESVENVDSTEDIESVEGSENVENAGDVSEGYVNTDSGISEFYNGKSVDTTVLNSEQLKEAREYLSKEDWWSYELFEKKKPEYLIRFDDEYVYTYKLSDNGVFRSLVGKNPINLIEGTEWGYRVYVEGYGLNDDGWIYETRKDDPDTMFYYVGWNNADDPWKYHSEKRCIMHENKREGLNYDINNLIDKYEASNFELKSEKVQLSAEDLYGTILYKYKFGISQEWNYDVCEYFDVTSDVGFGNTDYAFYDLNKDGTDELFILEKNEGFYGKNFILALYTISGGNVKPVFISLSNGAGDYGYYLYNGGYIMHKEGGTGYQSRAYCTLTKSGELLEEAVFEECYDETGNGEFYLSDGKSRKELSKEEFDKAEKEYSTKGVLELNHSFIEDYRNDIGKKAYDITALLRKMLNSPNVWFEKYDEFGNVIVFSGEIIPDSENGAVNNVIMPPYGEIENVYIINPDTMEGMDWYGKGLYLSGLEEEYPKEGVEVSLDDPDLKKLFEKNYVSWSIVTDSKNDDGEGCPRKYVKFDGDGYVYTWYAGYDNDGKFGYSDENMEKDKIASVKKTDSGDYILKIQRENGNYSYSFDSETKQVYYYMTWDEGEFPSSLSGSSSLMEDTEGTWEKYFN